MLAGSLVAYAVSTIVCTALTMANRTKRFDFDVIKARTGDFDPADSLEANASTHADSENALAGKDAS